MANGENVQIQDSSTDEYVRKKIRSSGLNCGDDNARLLWMKIRIKTYVIDTHIHLLLVVFQEKTCGIFFQYSSACSKVKVTSIFRSKRRLSFAGERRSPVSGVLFQRSPRLFAPSCECLRDV